jgi:transposase
MARLARHRIELTDEERAELVRIARAEKRPWQEVQRARIVLYAAEGMDHTEIAQRLDTTDGIVGKWRRRFVQERLEGLKDRPRSGRPRRFPPTEIAAVEAVARELPLPYGLPLSRFARVELHRLVVELAVSDASASTTWRWLHDAALKPWQQRSWIYRRDAGFEAKAARVLDRCGRRVRFADPG